MPTPANALPAKLTRAQQAAIDLVAAVPQMAVAELQTLWPQYFKVPPFSTNRAILAQSLAYRIQEEAFGGLSRSARSRLEAIAAAWNEGRVPSIAPTSKPKVRAGARLLRSWHGEVHEVTVLEDGFLYRGTTYRSLSEIARLITGTPWSGPLFFGLKKTRERLRSTKANSKVDLAAKLGAPVKVKSMGRASKASSKSAPKLDLAVFA